MPPSSSSLRGPAGNAFRKRFEPRPRGASIAKEKLPLRGRPRAVASAPTSRTTLRSLNGYGTTSPSAKALLLPMLMPMPLMPYAACPCPCKCAMPMPVLMLMLMFMLCSCSCALVDGLDKIIPWSDG